GEDPAEAARRELLEETGYAFDSIEQICQLYANPATSGNITYTYLLTGGRKVQEQELDSSEDIDVLLMSIEEAKTILFDNMIFHALNGSALFYTFIKLDLLYVSQILFFYKDRLPNNPPDFYTFALWQEKFLIPNATHLKLTLTQTSTRLLQKS